MSINITTLNNKTTYENNMAQKILDKNTEEAINEKINKKRKYIEDTILWHFNNLIDDKTECRIDSIYELPQIEIDSLVADIESKGYSCAINQYNQLCIN